MGLVGLSLTIRFNFTIDFTTAWYAVTLLPRTVVAGQGVRLWLRWPLIATAILVPAVQITASGSIIVTAFLGGIALATLAQSVTRSSAARRRVWSISVIPITLGLLTVQEGVILAAQEPSLRAKLASTVLEALGIAVDENSVAIGVMLILLGGFAIGIPSAIVFRPPLPRVKLEIDDEASNPSVAMKQGPNPLEGWLVAHSDGFWHLFPDESKELQSIPDEQVHVARTGGEVHTPPAKKGAACTEEATSEEEAKPGEGNTE
jgi:hypothetical protein